MRYIAEVWTSIDWTPIGIEFNTKKQLDEWIDRVDYAEWRCGYTFKPYSMKAPCRFVWNVGKKIGQEVRV